MRFLIWIITLELLFLNGVGWNSKQIKSSSDEVYLTFRFLFILKMNKIDFDSINLSLFA